MVTAPNGRIALERLQRDLQPNLVLTDLGMPVMDGVSLCKAIRSDPKLAHTKLIIVAAEDSIAVSSLACGADDYIRKPFELDNLVHAVERCLHQ